MLKLAVIDDEIEDLVSVLGNLRAEDPGADRISILPIYFGRDSEEAIRRQIEEKQSTLVKCSDSRIYQPLPQIVRLGPLDGEDSPAIEGLLRLLRTEKVDGILSDSWMGNQTAGIEILEKVLRDSELGQNGVQCWFMTKYLKEIAEAIVLKSCRNNTFPVHHYLNKTSICATKDGECDQQLRELVARIEVADSQRNESGLGKLVGQSPIMRKVFGQVKFVSKYDIAVLILGEVGTGKTEIASEIHNNSPRKEKELVRIDLAKEHEGTLESKLFGHVKGAFTGSIGSRKGEIERANGTTLFLDEIALLPLRLQPKLLTALEERYIEKLGTSERIKVDFRLISATSCNVAKFIDEGQLRIDLFSRIREELIVVPPLREHREDIPALVTSFLDRWGRKEKRWLDGVTDDALQILCSAEWPHNVRQLRNVVKLAYYRALDLEDSCIRADNPAVVEVAQEQKKVSSPQQKQTVVVSSDWSEAPASEVATAVMAGRVQMTVTRLAEYIGKRKFLDVAKYIREQLGRLPSSAEVGKWFAGDSYNNYKSRVDYYRKHLGDRGAAQTEES